MENLAERKAQERAILAEKIRNEIARRNPQAIEAFGRIERDNKALRDFIADGSALRFDLIDQGRTPCAIIGDSRFSIHRNALRQYAEKAGIPGRYLNQLLTMPGNGDIWGPKLAVDIMNRHSEHTQRDKLLLRAVDNDLRGVLSDHYRRLDSMQIIEQAMAAAQEAGATLLAAHQDATKQFVEFLHPHIYDIPTPKNGTVTIAIGFRYRNSDFGDGSLSLDAYEMQVWCLNGAVTQRLFREIHLGKQLPSDLRLSDKTMRLDTERSASLMADAVRTLFLPETIEHRFNVIKAASEREIDIKPRIQELPKLGFMKEEAEAVERTLLRSSPEDGVQGEPTLWKFAQAIGAVARNVSEERRRFLEEAAGGVMAEVDKGIVIDKAEA